MPRAASRSRRTARVRPLAGRFLELHALQKTYWLGATAVRALRGVTLSIREGEFVAIMGPSGSGKSTLMHVLGLLDIPDHGSYRLLGHEISGLDEDSLAALRGRTIGFVFQQFNLLPRLTAADNIELPLLYGGGARRVAGRTDTLARAFSLANRLDHRPSELSGGQQQRVAIARALVNAPRLILADEPTGNLDSHTQREIMDLLTRLNQAGLTIVLVTHEEEVARYARRVIWMRDGQVVTDRRQAGIVPARRLTFDGATLVPGSPAAAGGAATQPDGAAVPSRWVRSIRPALAHARAHVAEAMTSLVASKARAVLSTLGVAFGVAAVIAVLAIGAGAKRSIVNDMLQWGPNVISVRADWYQPHGRGSGSVITRLTAEDAAALTRASPDIWRTAPMVWTNDVTITAGDKDWEVGGVGCTTLYEDIRAWHPVAGRFFTADEDRSRARVLLIGRTVVQKLFPDGGHAVGTQVRIDRVPFTIIGILPEKTSFGRWDANDTFLVPLGTAMNRMTGKRFVDQIDVQLQGDVDPDAVGDRIKEFLSRRYRLKGGKDDAFEIRNEAMWRQMRSATTNTVSLLLAISAAISLVVGGIGIMNIMLVTVAERTREIGLRKAVGARSRDILAQFLMEAAAISGTGGLVGVGLGVFAALLIAALLKWTVYVSPGSIVLGFGVSAGVGILFGFWPARRAAALPPAEALRSE